MLGAAAAGMQYNALRGYNQVMIGSASDPTSPAPIIDLPEQAEVCKTKEDCVDCKKRPEAPEWWTKN